MGKQKPFLVAALAVLALALVIVGFKMGGPGSNGTASTQPAAVTRLEKVSLRLKWLHQAQFAGFYVAAQQHMYEAEGLEVMIRSGGQDMNAVRLVDQESDDFGIWGAEQVMIARANGMNVQAIGVVYQDTAACFLARADSGITNVKQFVGRKVGIQRGTDLDTIYNALLKINGVDHAQVHETPVAFNFSLFLENQLDVWPSYSVNEPFTAKKQGLQVNVILPGQNGLSFYGDTIICRATWVNNEKYRKTIDGFMRATARGWKWALDHPKEAAQTCLTYDGLLPLDHMQFMIESSIPHIRPPGGSFMRMSDERWLKIHDVLKDQGLLPAGKDVSVSEVYTNRFVHD